MLRFIQSQIRIGFIGETLNYLPTCTSAKYLLPTFDFTAYSNFMIGLTFRKDDS